MVLPSRITNRNTGTSSLLMTTRQEQEQEQVLAQALLNYDYSDGGKEDREVLVRILRSNAWDCRDLVTLSSSLANNFVLAGLNNDVGLLGAFLDNKMDVNTKGSDSWPCLLGASNNNCKEAVRFLLDHNADVDVRSSYDDTPLICACEHGFVQIAEMLLLKNANPDLQNKHGWTGLTRASQQGYTEIVQLLLHHNANLDLKDGEGKTALDLAKNEEIKLLLTSHVSAIGYVLK